MKSEKDYVIKKNVNLCKTDLKHYPYNSQTLIALLENVLLQYKANINIMFQHFKLQGCNGVPLLSLQTAISLGVIKVINSLKYDSYHRKEN